MPSRSPRDTRSSSDGGTRLAALVGAHVAASMRLFRTTVSVTTSLSFFALAQPALAANEPSAAPGILGDAERWLTAAAEGPTAASDLTMPSVAGLARDASSAIAERRATAPPAKEVPFVDFSSPRLSLVARDWRGSVRIAGDRKLLVDDLRPTASNRLVVARVATDARLTTFVQLGVGEWRIDPVMFPNARSYSEVAGQVSAGFELRLPSGVRLAGEAQYTALYHDLHYSVDEVAPRIVAFVVAIDGRF